MNSQQVISHEKWEYFEEMIDYIDEMLLDDSIYEEHEQKEPMVSYSNVVGIRVTSVTNSILFLIFSIVTLFMTRGTLRICFTAKTVVVTIALGITTLVFMGMNFNNNARQTR